MLENHRYNRALGFIEERFKPKNRMLIGPEIPTKPVLLTEEYLLQKEFIKYGVHALMAPNLLPGINTLKSANKIHQKTRFTTIEFVGMPNTGKTSISSRYAKERKLHWYPETYYSAKVKAEMVEENYETLLTIFKQGFNVSNFLVISNLIEEGYVDDRPFIFDRGFISSILFDRASSLTGRHPRGNSYHKHNEKENNYINKINTLTQFVEYNYTIVNFLARPKVSLDLARRQDEDVTATPVVMTNQYLQALYEEHMLFHIRMTNSQNDFGNIFPINYIAIDAEPEGIDVVYETAKELLDEVPTSASSI